MVEAELLEKDVLKANEGLSVVTYISRMTTKSNNKGKKKEEEKPGYEDGCFGVHNASSSV